MSKRENNRFPAFCKSCKLFVSNVPLGFYKCEAGYKNPPTTEQARANQIKHGGEFPCIYNPLRSKKVKLSQSIAESVEQKQTT